jgi:hypothetical protein
MSLVHQGHSAECESAIEASAMMVPPWQLSHQAGVVRGVGCCALAGPLAGLAGWFAFIFSDFILCCVQA